MKSANPPQWKFRNPLTDRCGLEPGNPPLIHSAIRIRRNVSTDSAPSGIHRQRVRTGSSFYQDEPVSYS